MGTHRRRTLLGAFACTAVAAACTPTRAPASDPSRGGGSIVVAAEQYPRCLNPIQSCANSSWLSWVVTGQVLPKAMTVDPKGNFVASPLLTEAPSIDNGGIRHDPFSVTFKIDPRAVWDDGSPITSGDFEFTWQAFLETTGSLSTNGYDKITKVDTTDPKAATVVFSEPFADWWDLFGGNTGFVLKKSAFREGKVDLEDEMTDTIPFSGWYWKLESYGLQQLVLVRNPRWWGTPALLDRVTVVPREDSSTEVNSLLSGEVSAIFPQPNTEMPKRLRSNPNVDFTVDVGPTYEGLWMNLSRPPLNNRAVREAVVWATDRQAVIDTIIKPINPKAEPLNCGGWVPTVGRWCNEDDFAKYTYDPARAMQILEADGWTKAADGIFAKGRTRLSIEFSTTTGNKGREDTQALLKEKWRAAGIELVVKNYASPSPIFTDILPKLNYQVAEYAQTASPDPSVTVLYACDQIPSEANSFGGQNFDAWCNREASDLARQSDRTIDVDERVKLVHRIGALVAADLPWFPLYQKPLITAWRKDKLAGPVGSYTSSSFGGFYNMYEWSVR